ncbi:glucosyltransferase domain-containing protein [Candidatus Babeliales bacterium]|nr:glucosyltransferase domain-containing protein [Candidatus Babeliales bacterium]MCF7899750.1 glucosyltransferase domain-containing protein [Candidatus Babeliales bacterium]
MKKIINKSFYIFLKYKNIFISTFLFILVFALLGLPYTNWWLGGCDDAAGIFIGYKTKNWKDLFYFFYDGNTNPVPLASNYPIPTKGSFFSTYYRPLHCIYLTFQYWLFETNVYYYLLTNVFFHAINTILFFNIFLFFTSTFPAFLFSMFFAFHPQIAYRFGAIVNLHYYINIMLVLLTLLFFKKYLDSKKYLFYGLSILCFILSLFTRESTVVLPAIIFLGTYLYKNINYSIKDFFKKFILILQQTSIFFIISIGFLSLRAYLYPIVFNNNLNKTFSITSILKAKLAGLQVAIYDFLGFSWLPWGQKLYRGIIVVSILSFLFWLFIKNTKKIHILYFIFSAGLILWPGFIGNNYCPRYYYEAAPFAIASLVVLFTYSKINETLKKIIYFIFTIFIIFLSYFAIECFQLRENKMQIMHNAFTKLIKKPEVQKRDLCFLDCPAEGFGGVIPMFWIHFNNPEHKIYHDPITSITQADSHIMIPTKWKNKISNYFDQNYVQVARIDNSFKFTSLNHKKVVFYIDPKESSIGKIKINKTIKTKNGEAVTDFTLSIDEKYTKNNPLFINWDYTRQCFKIVEF